jgi:hypothetical protein
MASSSTSCFSCLVVALVVIEAGSLAENSLGGRYRRGAGTIHPLPDAFGGNEMASACSAAAVVHLIPDARPGATVIVQH